MPIELIWYNDPIHCPFCGEPVNLQDSDPYGGCEHWLYTAYDEYLTRAQRFNTIAELPDDLDDELYSEEKKLYGSWGEVIIKNKPKFYNLIEFDLSNNHDGWIVAFSDTIELPKPEKESEYKELIPMGLYNLVTKDGELYIQDLDENLLRTPEGDVIKSHNFDFMKYLIDYVSQFEEELDGAKSPYGLISSYMDFDFENRYEEYRESIISNLDGDPLQREEYQWLSELLSNNHKICFDLEYYSNSINKLNAIQVTALNSFIANYGSPILGYNFLLNNIELPDVAITTICGIYEHANQFDDLDLKEKALQGAFIDTNSYISIPVDEQTIDNCRQCIFNGKTSFCIIKNNIDFMKQFASFSEI